MYQNLPRLGLTDREAALAKAQLEIFEAHSSPLWPEPQQYRARGRGGRREKRRRREQEEGESRVGSEERRGGRSDGRGARREKGGGKRKDKRMNRQRPRLNKRPHPNPCLIFQVVLCQEAKQNEAANCGSSAS